MKGESGLQDVFNAPHRWFASSKHKICDNIRHYGGLNIKYPQRMTQPADPPAFAIVLVADCNMGGRYYREIYWKPDKSRYFTVQGDNEMDVIFDVEFDEMKPGVVVTDNRTKQTYKVFDREHKYIKLLEIIK